MSEIIFSEDCDRNMNNETAWKIKSILEDRIQGNRIIGWVSTDGYCFLHTLVRLLQSNQVQCVINDIPELATFLSGVVASGLLFCGENPDYQFDPHYPEYEKILQVVVMLLNININVWHIDDDDNLSVMKYYPKSCSTHLHENSLCSFKDNFVEMFQIQIPREIKFELDFLLYGGHFYPLENNNSSNSSSSSEALEARRKAELEAHRKAELEAHRKAELEARRIAEELEQLEARRIAEELEQLEARQIAEYSARQIAEELKQLEEYEACQMAKTRQIAEGKARQIAECKARQMAEDEREAYRIAKQFEADQIAEDSKLARELNGAGR